MINKYLILFVLLCVFTILHILLTKKYYKHKNVRYIPISSLHHIIYNMETSLPYSNQTNYNSLIPNIIHQTYKTKVIPEQWEISQRRVKIFHLSFKYKLWTDEDIRELIKTKHPSFLNTYDNYLYPIQRVDAAKYFILYYYGGFYIDLDIGSLRSLSNLRVYPCILPETTPIGYSNDFIGSIPGHPFMKQLIDALPLTNINYIIPTITIFLSTGPLFITNQYNIAAYENIKNVYILPNELYTKKYGFFFHVIGNSWHMIDTIIINYIYYNIYMLIFLIIIIFITIYNKIYILLFIRNTYLKYSRMIIIHPRNIYSIDNLNI